jgi:hypothetical protein
MSLLTSCSTSTVRSTHHSITLTSQEINTTWYIHFINTTMELLFTYRTVLLRPHTSRHFCRRHSRNHSRFHYQAQRRRLRRKLACRMWPLDARCTKRRTNIFFLRRRRCPLGELHGIVRTLFFRSNRKYNIDVLILPM